MYMQFYWLQKLHRFPLDPYADSVVNRATGPTPAFGISDWVEYYLIVLHIRQGDRGMLSRTVE